MAWRRRGPRRRRQFPVPTPSGGRGTSGRRPNARTREDRNLKTNEGMRKVNNEMTQDDDDDDDDDDGGAGGTGNRGGHLTAKEVSG